MKRSNQNVSVCSCENKIDDKHIWTQGTPSFLALQIRTRRKNYVLSLNDV